MIKLDYTEVHHSRKIRGTEQGESMEDRRFRVILTKGLHKNAGGNREAPLPFKTDTVLLTDNNGHCLSRLLSLTRRLLNDNKLKDAYLVFMKKSLDNRHVSRVPADQLTTAKGKAWYLPHFHVHHPRKPDKIRVVFDCSAVYENEWLNKHLLSGPDQLNPWFNPWLACWPAFVKKQSPSGCDIEQMFHSFYVNSNGRDYLRFLWFANNDLTGPIVEYRMNNHLFGAASSPGVENVCLHQTAEEGS